MNLLKWTLLPGCFAHPCDVGDGGGGGDGGAGAQAAADESRKAALRSRIDKLYGISDEKTPIYGESSAKYFKSSPTGDFLPSEDATPTQRVMTRQAYTGPVSTKKSIFGGADSQVADDGSALEVEGTPAPIIGYQDDPEALAARGQMDSERTQLSDATRGFYNDQLARSFGAAERNNRFRLARQGLQGGSEDVDSNANLETDRTLGATRIDDAARRAAAGLDTQREQERVGAIQLVNSGAGESAVNSAQAGLRNALNTASSANKANLFGDLFSSGADAYSNMAAQQQAAGMLAQYQKALGTYFPSSNSSGGRVTPSA